MSNAEENKPPINSEDIPVDVGVFNLTVAWYQSLAGEYGPEFAAQYVSSYLHRLANGIAAQLESETEEETA